MCSNGSPVRDNGFKENPLRDLLVADKERQNGVSSSQSNPECDSTAPIDLEVKTRHSDINLRTENDKGAASKEKMSLLQLKLDEATRTISRERE